MIVFVIFNNFIMIRESTLYYLNLFKTTKACFMAQNTIYLYNIYANLKRMCIPLLGNCHKIIT